jgi:transcriptional regulator with XRE-family HTH domain
MGRAVTYRATVGARLRAEREGRSWSRVQLAARLRARGGDGLPSLESLAHMVKEWERGLHAPDERYQRLYCTVLGTDEATLFGASRRAQSPWVEGADGDVDRERLVAASARPALVDRGVVEALELVLAGQRRLEDAVGAEPLLEPVGAQLVTVDQLLRQARSEPVRRDLAGLVTDWTTYAGWLRAATRQDRAALRLFDRALELADEHGYGAGAALATSFKGYVARRQGRPLAVVRAAAGAMATPGATVAQRAFDALQAAQGYAELGEHHRVRALLDQSADLAGTMGEPPPAVYWYSKPFFKLNVGVALAGIGEHADAVSLLREGLAGLPTDQRRTEWVREYDEALKSSSERA